MVDEHNHNILNKRIDDPMEVSDGYIQQVV